MNLCKIGRQGLRGWERFVIFEAGLPEDVHRMAHHEGALHQRAVEVDEAVGEVDLRRGAIVEELELAVAPAIVGGEEGGHEAVRGRADEQVHFFAIGAQGAVDEAVVERVDDFGEAGVRRAVGPVDGVALLLNECFPGVPWEMLCSEAAEERGRGHRSGGLVKKMWARWLNRSPAWPI